MLDDGRLVIDDLRVMVLPPAAAGADGHSQASIWARERLSSCLPKRLSIAIISVGARRGVLQSAFNLFD